MQLAQVSDLQIQVDLPLPLSRHELLKILSDVLYVEFIRHVKLHYLRQSLRYKVKTVKLGAFLHMLHVKLVSVIKC
jgi:hypothetical protein